MTSTRSGGRRARTLAVLLAGLLALGTGLAQPAVAAPATVTVDCNTLAGSGRYADPIPLGVITTTTVVLGCSPLSFGRYDNVRYFAFALAAPPSPNALVMTAFRAGPGKSGVHPRLAFGPVTVRHSLDAVHTAADGAEAYGHSMAGLWAGADWRVGAEKLETPLRSLESARFDLVIVP